MNTGISSLRVRARGEPGTGTSPLVYHAGAVSLERLGIAGERPGGDRLAQLGKQGQVIVQVVDCRQPRAEDLIGALQVMQIGAAEMAAGVARAARIERRGIGAVAGVTDLDVAIAGEQPPITGVACR